MRDSRNVTAVCDDAEELAPDQVLAARRTVAANSENAEQATETMQMLGIFPGQQNEQFATNTLPQPPRSFT